MHMRSIGTAWFLIEAATLRELAAKIGLDADALEQTVAVFNESATRGVDPAFGRGGNVYDRWQGDPDHQPNSNLAPLTAPPSYGLAMHPGDVSSIYGLRTSIDAEVLNAAAEPVRGLYAVGLDQNSLYHGFYPGGGSSIGPGMIFGYRAARHMAGVT